MLQLRCTKEWGGYGVEQGRNLNQLPLAVLAAECLVGARLPRRPWRYEHADAPGGAPRRGHQPLPLTLRNSVPGIYRTLIESDGPPNWPRRRLRLDCRESN